MTKCQTPVLNQIFKNINNDSVLHISLLDIIETILTILTQINIRHIFIFQLL